MNCPRCHQPLERSEVLIPGVVIYGCRKVCRLFAVEPPEGIGWEWVEGGPGLVDRLRRSNEQAVATVKIQTSGDDDPRWETWEIGW
jgi:hypothetical protein